MTVVAVLLLCAGCALPTKVTAVSPDIPRDLTPIAIEAGLQAMDDPATKERMARMLKSPETKAMERELVAGMIDGLLATMADKQRVERIGAISSQYMGSVLHGVLKEQGPLAQAGVKSFSDAGVGTSMSKAITDQLGPALQQALKDNLAPGLAGALESEQVQHAIGATARVMGREMVLGVNEGFAQIKEGKPEGRSTLTERLGNLASKGATLASSITWLLAAVVLALVAWVVKLMINARRYHSEREQRTMTTRLLSEAMKASEGKPWADELLAALEKQSRADEEALTHVRGARRMRNGAAAH